MSKKNLHRVATMDFISEKRFYDYNTFLRRRFGGKVYKISVDAGFTCPNIDGKVGVGGCIYCNNASFAPPWSSRAPVSEQILAGIEAKRRDCKSGKYLIYFQSHTNTYAPVGQLQAIYAQALQYPDVVGITIGTRPDEVDAEKIRLLEEMAKTTFVSIEYGVQTTNDETLRSVNRGHTYESFLRAMEITRGRGIHICAHIMLGFPNETREEMLAVAGEMNRVKVDAVKLHQLLITRDTVLAHQYLSQPFHVFAYEEYRELICDFIERLSPNIVLERLFATASPEYLIAPQWSKSPGQITDDIRHTLTQRNSHQGSHLKRECF